MQKLSDIRAFKVVQAVIASAGGKDVEPGQIFASLADIPLTGEEVESEEDLLQHILATKQAFGRSGSFE